nr:hypothetical protein [Tanacetum cinerariifolium]
EADASLAKYKNLELEIERLLKAVVSQDIIFVVQNSYVVDTSDLRTELEHTQNQLFQKLKNANVELEFQLFKKVSDQKENTRDSSKNTKFAKQPNVEILPEIGKTNALSKQVTSNSVSTPLVSKGNIRQPFQRMKRNKKNQPEIKKPKKVGFIKTLATPKPRMPRFLLRWSSTSKMFDQDGKLVAPSNSESHVDCSNGDNACTSNTLEPKNKRFPNFTCLLSRLSRFVCGASTQVVPST